MQSLEHGLAVIRAFGTDRARMTLSEVAREAALSRASARRSCIPWWSSGMP
ncbi:helix-turn-helix domain-containing protein [Promicromonospora soli]|uniref:helix-turn-helix domain-containing protein n=1 Tax=Promicromonospora soli TaxID=2035533 RepID=UPI001E5B9C39|nr:helix-turn-helix domain-containing protein [Promicromonospora soli]